MGMSIGDTVALIATIVIGLICIVHSIKHKPFEVNKVQWDEVDTEISAQKYKGTERRIVTGNHSCIKPEDK